MAEIYDHYVGCGDGLRAAFIRPANQLRAQRAYFLASVAFAFKSGVATVTSSQQLGEVAAGQIPVERGPPRKLSRPFHLSVAATEEAGRFCVL